MTDLTPRQRQVLEFIDAEVRHRGYPPSVREIGEAVGLSSSSTVHAHLAALQDKGYLTRDPTKPRALEVHLDVESGAPIERRPVRHVPLVGDVAAGTGVLAAENIEETLPVPEDFTGDGDLFMLRVRGDSMIEAGIFDGDYVVVRQQPTPTPATPSSPASRASEATVKTFLRRRNKIVLRPENSTMDEMVFDPRDVTIYGKVVTLLRRLCSAALDARERSSCATPTNRASAAYALLDRRPRHELARGVRDGRVAGAEVERGDPAGREAGDVGPPELRAAPARSRGRARTRRPAGW